MEEIAPGLWHWRARHPHINSLVSSYYLVPEGVLIDPMVPLEGVDWFEQHGAPQHVLLSNRHHDRDAWRLREAFGCTVHCISNGVYELADRGPVEPFEFGDELPGGVHVHEVDAICADETALYIASRRALACADGIVRAPGGGPLSFVPDWLMDDPEQTRQELCEAYRGLLELDFDVLLLAHGEPVVRGGKEALREFATREL